MARPYFRLVFGGGETVSCCPFWTDRLPMGFSRPRHKFAGWWQERSVYQGKGMTADEVEGDEGIVGLGSEPELEMIHRVER